jgi:hypothetical protein
MGEDKVVCATPTPGKQTTRIDRWKYQAVRRAILDTLDGSANGILFKDLSAEVAARLSSKEKASLGSVGWYTTTVKLDMEVKGEISRVPGESPQRLIRRSVTRQK